MSNDGHAGYPSATQSYDRIFGMAGKDQPGRLPPAVNSVLLPEGIEREVRTPDVGSYAKEARIASGGLDDDPTDSGAPVKNRHSYANLKGGR
jgi:hypothetical protein